MRYWLLSVLAAYTCVCVGQEAVSPRESVPGVEPRVIVVPLRLESNRPYIDVYVNGRGPLNFVIDTGATGDGRIDAAPAAELGLPIVSQEVNDDGVGRATENVVELNRIWIGSNVEDPGSGFVRERVSVMTRDYNPPSRDPSLPRIDGILGIDFFRGYVATIDFPGRRLVIERGRLSPDAKYVLKYSEPNSVEASVGGVSYDVHIDTGSVLTAHLPLSMAEALASGELSEAGTGRRAYTTFTLYRGLLGSEMVLAGNRIHGLDVMFSERAPDINIGSGLLSRYAVSIDVSSRLFRIGPDAPGAADVVLDDAGR